MADRHAGTSDNRRGTRSAHYELIWEISGYDRHRVIHAIDRQYSIDNVLAILYYGIGIIAIKYFSD